MSDLPSDKQWWAPVWKGLVIDPDAKHYRRMKNAVWLYLYLLMHANRRTGILKRKIRTIESGMGITRDTAIRWLNVLRRAGYVTTVNTGRSLTIHIHRWKPIIPAARNRLQRSDSSDLRSGKNPTPSYRRHPPNLEQIDRTWVGRAAANKTQIEIKLHNHMHKSPFDEPPDRPLRADQPWLGRERLAHELAQSLDDAEGINRYRGYTWRYPEGLLRKVLAEVDAMPSAGPGKRRYEVFNELLEHHVKGTN